MKKFEQCQVLRRRSNETEADATRPKARIQKIQGNNLFAFKAMQLRYLKTIHQPPADAKDGKFQKVTSIAFSPNHYRLAVATVDRYILLYDENGDLQDKFPTKPAEKVLFLIIFSS